jgi:hypothetical protein
VLDGSFSFEVLCLSVTKLCIPDFTFTMQVSVDAFEVVCNLL